VAALDPQREKWRDLVVRDRIGEVVPLGDDDAVTPWTGRRAIAERERRCQARVTRGGSARGSRPCTPDPPTA
jgi:hypothetical protein